MSISLCYSFLGVCMVKSRKKWPLCPIMSRICAQVLCSGAITNFTKLYVERLLDNLIPPGDLARPLSLLIFTLSLIQAPSLFLCLHNVGFLSFPFLCSLISFFPSPAPTPKPLRQHAAYANHWPFILNTRPPT